MIDPKLQAELRAKYNPDGSNLRKMQLRMLDMLKYIDKICRENNIQYWLSSGTCLGAVRHEGFIPWDDDIDIEMLDKDFKKLVKVLQKSESNKFALQTHSTDNNYIYDYGKLRDLSEDIPEFNSLYPTYKFKGLSIDLFRLEQSNSRTIHYICGRMRLVEYHMRRIFIKHRHVSKVLGYIIRYLNNIIFSLLKPFDHLMSNGQLRHVLGVTFLKPRYKQDIFPLRLIKFEEYEFPIPGNYDSYLRKMFGDYMVFKQDHIHLNY